MADNILLIDKFVVINHTLLNDTDRLSLTLLYQPIVGSIAISLYFTLWSFTLDDDLTHYDIVSNMQVKLEDICIAKEKLEAIGLLKTYYKQGEINSYVYELYNPLSVYEFTQNPILDTALFNNIGKVGYKRTMNKFNTPKINLEDYKDTSKSFKDVFSFEVSERINDKNIVKAKCLGLDFEPTINLNEILNSIPEQLINKKSITNNVKTLIYQLALIYNLDDESIKEIIIDSLETNKKINVEVLKENCRNYYKFENKNKVPGIVYRNQPLAWRSNTKGMSKLDLMINEYDNTTPYDLLLSRNNGVAPTKNDLRLLESLLTDYNLKPGVVNVLIDYVLKINGNKLNKTYIEQIATQWVRSNINTVADAIEIAKNNNKKPKQKIKKEPDWIDKEIESDLLSEEEIRELEMKMGCLK